MPGNIRAKKIQVIMLMPTKHDFVFLSIQLPFWIDENKIDSVQTYISVNKTICECKQLYNQKKTTVTTDEPGNNKGFQL